MACLDNVQIKTTVTYDSSPDVANGLLSGDIEVDILNSSGGTITGTVTVDKVRDMASMDLTDPPIEDERSISSDNVTYSYDFYYPTSEPESITINVAVAIRINDCLYSAECNHVLLTPNDGSETSECTVEVFGFEVVSGCTNPLYYEYNPLANVDDGSCANLIPVLGCTNPLATNYNPNATRNDGSCVFPSGCTNPIANNYDPQAVIDDGSCACGDINLQLNFFDFSGESFALTGDCDYFIEFDLITKIDCEKFLAYFENDDRTILEILNSLKINAQVHVLQDGEGNNIEYSGGTVDISGTPEYILAQNENIYEFDIDNNPIGVGLIDSNDSCDTLLSLIAFEQGLECESFDSTKFNVSWQNYKIGINSDLLGTFTKYVLNFENFRFGICAYVDNLKFSRICTNSYEKCLLIPSTYGFELERVKDNKKSWVNSNEVTTRKFNSLEGRETEYLDYDSRLIFNTKELELQINPVKYIQTDVINYYNYYEKYYTDVDDRYIDINLEKVENQYIDVKNRQVIRTYSFLPTIYEQYKNEVDCAPSKGLDYAYGFEVIEKSGAFWYSLVKQLVPTTSIWKENQYILKNTIFDAQKFQYRRYSLEQASGQTCVMSGVTLNCNIISDKCFDESFTTIDDIFVSGSDIECNVSGESLCYNSFEGNGSFSGKLVQYQENDDGSNEILNIIGFENYICLSGDVFS